MRKTRMFRVRKITRETLRPLGTCTDAADVIFSPTPKRGSGQQPMENEDGGSIHQLTEVCVCDVTPHSKPHAIVNPEH